MQTYQRVKICVICHTRLKENIAARKNDVIRFKRNWGLHCAGIVNIIIVSDHICIGNKAFGPSKKAKMLIVKMLKLKANGMWSKQNACHRSGRKCLPPTTQNVDSSDRTPQAVNGYIIKHERENVTFFRAWRRHAPNACDGAPPGSENIYCSHGERDCMNQLNVADHHNQLTAKVCGEGRGKRLAN